MADVVEDWVIHLEKQGKSEATIKAYRAGVQHLIHWLEAGDDEPFDLAAVITRDLRDWIADQQAVKKAKPATINRRLAAVSQFFKWAVKRGYIPSDPTEGIEGLRLERRRPKAIDRTDLRRLLRTVHRSGSLRDVAILELLVGTGLRASEVVALSAGDLDFDTRPAQVIVRRGKGGVQRTVPLTAEVRRALTDYLEQHPRGADEPLWSGQRGSLKDPASVWRIVKKYAFLVGLEDEVSSHVLRHTFATQYLEANPNDLRGLAALLGHSSLDTVMIYTEPTAEQLLVRMEKAGHNSAR